MKRLALILFFAVVSCSLAGPVDHIKNMLRARRALNASGSAPDVGAPAHWWKITADDANGSGWCKDWGTNITMVATAYVGGCTLVTTNGFFYSYDGADDYLGLGSGAGARLLETSKVYTITLWLSSTVNVSTVRYIFDTKVGRIILSPCAYNDASGNTEKWGYFNGSNWKTLYEPWTNCNDGAWHHYAFALGANVTNVIFYKDGELSVTITNGWPAAGLNMSQDACIGANNTGGAGIAGYLDDFRIYTNILTSTQVENIKNIAGRQ